MIFSIIKMLLKVLQSLVIISTFYTDCNSLNSVALYYLVTLTSYELMMQNMFYVYVLRIKS